MMLLCTTTSRNNLFAIRWYRFCWSKNGSASTKADFHLLYRLFRMCRGPTQLIYLFSFMQNFPVAVQQRRFPPIVWFLRVCHSFSVTILVSWIYLLAFIITFWAHMPMSFGKSTLAAGLPISWSLRLWIVSANASCYERIRPRHAPVSVPSRAKPGDLWHGTFCSMACIWLNCWNVGISNLIFTPFFACVV